MFKSVYAFLGEDEIRMLAKARSLVENAVQEAYRDFNLNKFSPGDVSVQQIEEAVLQYPLGEGRRVVMVRNMGGFAPADQEAIAELAERTARVTDGATTLALLAPGLDRRRKPYKILAGLNDQPSGQVLIFEAPKPWQIDGWIADRAAERGIRLEKGAAEALVEIAGEDLRVLDGELTKLELFLGTGSPVEVEAVEKVVGRRRGESPWNLPRTLFSGDGASAQKLASRLLESGHSAVFLLSVLTRHTLEVYQIRLMLDEGAGRANIIKEVGIKPFAADSAIDAARRISPDAFPVIIETLKECDIALKSRSKQDGIVIQKAIGSIVLQTGIQRG